ncbi:type VII secretion target [Nocardia sp. NPDC050406]|uniref:type VII secretion target n=1 Tax=Nocardia sp. NPDC050406 TaxID=3364318 RepID=UPI0037966A98
MAEKIVVDPQHLRTAATTADEIRDRLSALAADARLAAAAGSAAWGDDKFGSKFADGAEGFAEGSGNMATSADTMATTFGKLAEGLITTANVVQATEQTNRDGFK